MKLRLNAALAGLALICAAIATAGFLWFQKDRAGMLSALCEAGLPNFSRPASVPADMLGCAILGPRERVRGVLLTGFEASNFMAADLGPPPAGGGFTGNTWYICNQVRRCDRGRLARQLDQPITGLCRVGLASVVVDGWATITPGNYGHLGVYSREFFEDQVVDAGPPPASLVEDMRQRWGEAGVGTCH
jgi:hypothetical protein